MSSDAFLIKKCLLYFFYWLIVILRTMVTVPALTAVVLKLLVGNVFKICFLHYMGLILKIKSMNSSFLLTK